ncbi:MAG: putative type IV restriction endonuclease [Flavobacteriales bacterium]|jgi:predicted type IV restriction endonuclease
MPNMEAFDFEPRTRMEGEERQIFDPVRKGWFVLTPEEFVRQFYIAFMSTELGYPISRMSCEITVKGNGPIKRADLIIYNRAGQPIMICEFKRMNVSIDKETLFQAARYNRDLGAKYVFVANGKEQMLVTLDLEHGQHTYTTHLVAKEMLE